LGKIGAKITPEYSKQRGIKAATRTTSLITAVLFLCGFCDRPVV